MDSLRSKKQSNWWRGVDQKPTSTGGVKSGHGHGSPRSFTKSHPSIFAIIHRRLQPRTSSGNRQFSQTAFERSQKSRVI